MIRQSTTPITRQSRQTVGSEDARMLKQPLTLARWQIHLK
jgi:hypothetical protein